MYRLTPEQIARLDRLHSAPQFAGTSGGKEVCRIIDLRTRTCYAHASGANKPEALEAALIEADRIGSPKSVSELANDENAVLKAKVDELQSKLVAAQKQTAVASRASGKKKHDEDTPDEDL